MSKIGIVVSVLMLAALAAAAACSAKFVQQASTFSHCPNMEGSMGLLFDSRPGLRLTTSPPPPPVSTIHSEESMGLLFSGRPGPRLITPPPPPPPPFSTIPCTQSRDGDGIVLQSSTCTVSSDHAFCIPSSSTLTFSISAISTRATMSSCRTDGTTPLSVFHICRHSCSPDPNGCYKSSIVRW